VPVYSKLYFIEIKSKQKRNLDIGNQIFGEVALYILEGAIKNEGNIYESNQILVAKESSLCEFEIQENTTIYIFGGEPLPEKRYIHWNFVSSDKQLIEKAKENWINEKFPSIPEENDRVPHPSE
jgi:redox-sensitive bicupin YhaK (pirin superfamily)